MLQHSCNVISFEYVGKKFNFPLNTCVSWKEVKYSLAHSSGLMVTSAALYHTLHFFNITIDIRNVCVFLAPLFSSLTTIVTYLLTKEIHVS